MLRASTARELSKLLFNAQHRMAVAAVFAPPCDDVLDLEEVAERCGVSRSGVHKELRVLVTIGAVHRFEAGRVVQYQRAESPFWPFLAHLFRQAEGDAQASSGPTASAT